MHDRSAVVTVVKKYYLNNKLGWSLMVTDEEWKDITKILIPKEKIWEVKTGSCVNRQT